MLARSQRLIWRVLALFLLLVAALLLTAAIMSTVLPGRKIIAA
jgi:hypothetical protein